MNFIGQVRPQQLRPLMVFTKADLRHRNFSCNFGLNHILHVRGPDKVIAFSIIMPVVVPKRVIRQLDLMIDLAVLHIGHAVWFGSKRFNNEPETVMINPVITIPLNRIFSGVGMIIKIVSFSSNGYFFSTRVDNHVYKIL